MAQSGDPPSLLYAGRAWQSERFETFDMLLTDADQKERIARIQQSIAELSAQTNDKK